MFKEFLKSNLSARKFIENNNIINMITELTILEKSQGQEYPRSQAYLNYYNSLLNERGGKLKQILIEMFDYLAYGDIYLAKTNNLADRIRKNLYELGIEKAKEIYTPYNTRDLNQFIEEYKIKTQGMRDYDKVFEYLYEIKDLMENPYQKIIPEMTSDEFKTIKQEITWILKLIKKESKRNFLIFDDSIVFSKLENAIGL